MAVQAQYPSNVLLLNRSVQEGKNQLGNDYSLQPQPGAGGGGFLDQSHTMIFSNKGNDFSLQPQQGGGGGGFLDQSHMKLFTNRVGTNNPRKRGREVTATTTSPINSFSIQPHHHAPQLIDLTQLQSSQPNVVSTGLRLAFSEQQQQQQQQSFSPQSSVLLSLLSEDLATQIRQQRDEIEQYIQAQGEQLRRTLAEKRQRHYRELLGAAEESVARRLREKEAEVEKSARRNAELQARAAHLSAEAQVWQARVRAQEAAAASLQEQLQRAMMSGAQQQQQKDRGEELGCGGGGEAEDAESAYIDPDRVVATSGPSCKACCKRVASVVLLPCRHLCLCTECDTVAHACPLCRSFRESSVEVFLS